MSENLKTYKVKVKYTFTGTVEVQAESKQRAKFIVENGFGGLNVNVSEHSSYLIEKNIFETTQEGIIDWDFDLKPTDTKIS